MDVRAPLQNVTINTRVWEWANTHLENWKSKEVASRVLVDTEGQLDICYKDSFLWSVKGWVCSQVLRQCMEYPGVFAANKSKRIRSICVV
ncbi:unnamed protein product [Heligmosomoides polygyrus]|uniref:NADAR domain-containing protein n=1 Tax=Heligmosomoides polygyrus TaxID=6339 RepID=A0A183FQU9_HELPZ|nr:unnamed protein product [Heligmosomoides polygyrus]